MGTITKILSGANRLHGGSDDDDTMFADGGSRYSRGGGGIGNGVTCHVKWEGSGASGIYPAGFCGNFHLVPYAEALTVPARGLSKRFVVVDTLATCVFVTC